MARTTFTGQIVAGEGLVTSPFNVGQTITSATATIPAAIVPGSLGGIVDGTEQYNGYLTLMSRAAGITITLPAASGSQAVYRFLVITSLSSNSHIIKVANSTDVFIGSCAVSGTTGTTFSTLATSDTITMNATTQGGLAGSWVEVQDMRTGFWRVSGGLLGSGTVITPFSATV